MSDLGTALEEFVKEAINDIDFKDEIAEAVDKYVEAHIDDAIESYLADSDTVKEAINDIDFTDDVKTAVHDEIEKADIEGLVEREVENLDLDSLLEKAIEDSDIDSEIERQVEKYMDCNFGDAIKQEMETHLGNDEFLNNFVEKIVANKDFLSKLVNHPKFAEVFFAEPEN
jgi:Arc/MetJ-type ribon-helix-helix transcriptional regulator